MYNYYTNLSNKWRPKRFEEIIGQKYIILALINSLKQKKIFPCYLFNGPRGTGKTTLARLLAKSLLCKRDINFNPCNKCFNCIQINNNNFLDLVEINGALNTKLENIKELIITTNYMPSIARYRIYIIDEIHMLSKHSFNALLKILEEPPLHIKFILATTNIGKIPDTIISRCLLLNLNLINYKEMYIKLKKIFIKENIIYKKSIINNIIILAKGSMRDALSILDYTLLISNKNKLININLFKKYIGENYHPYCLILIKYLLNNNIKNILKLINKMYKLNIISWNKIIDYLIILIHKIIINKILLNNNNIKLITYLKKISKNIKINKIIYIYKGLLKCKKELNIFYDNRIIIELNFIKLILLNNNIL